MFFKWIKVAAQRSCEKLGLLIWISLLPVKRVSFSYHLGNDCYAGPQGVKVDTARVDTVISNGTLGKNASQKGQREGTLRKRSVQMRGRVHNRQTLPLPVRPTGRNQQGRYAGD